jgi:hypothetical protein
MSKKNLLKGATFTLGPGKRDLHLSNLDWDIILFCAFRYALGRRTYVVGTVINAIISEWDHMPDVTRQKFISEIKDAISKDQAGDKWDAEDWTRILKLDLNYNPNRVIK